jgi:uncharacterized protein YvpB
MSPTESYNYSLEIRQRLENKNLFQRPKSKSKLKFLPFKFNHSSRKSLSLGIFLLIGLSLISSPFGFLYFYANNVSQTSLAKDIIVTSSKISSSNQVSGNIFSSSKSSQISEISSQSLSSISSSPTPTTSANLDVELIKQQYKLSCEASDLQMALSFFGIKKTQDELLLDFGYSQPAKILVQNGKPIWGDPELGFVGDVNGNFKVSGDGAKDITSLTGWGTTNTVVAKAAQKYRPNSTAVKNATIEEVQKALIAGSPVIFWHQRDDAPQGTFEYTTPAGKKITMITNHVAVLTGFSKNADGQTIYNINDPFYGKYQLDEANLVRIWSKYNKDIVIIR